MDLPLRYLKGIGPKKEKIFKNLGIHTVRDLLYHFPFRYEDKSNFKKIKDLKENESSLIKGKILARNFRKIFFSKKVKDIFEVVLEDETGRIRCVWFNQPYLVDSLKVGKEVIVYGRPFYEKGSFLFISPEYEFVNKDSLNLGRIVGVYRLTSSLTQKFMRRVIHYTLGEFKKKIKDPLPFYIRREKNFFNIAKGLEEIHFPTNWENAQKSRQRFIFEELFFSQILVYLRKAKHRQQEGVPLRAKEEILKRIGSDLNFSLTNSQKRVISEIIQDLEKPYPMHRLLQGEVGSGKTVVASFAFAVCCSLGYQAALMVPTEVLAYQHRDTLEEILNGLDFNIEVLVSSLAQKKIKKIHQELKEGKIDIVVGTHALIQEEVEFKNLALVVIDEQHKFGVGQRALLPKKAKVSPHCLIMSATPIPRSLALSLYGDLDLSLLKELPPQRRLPKTIWVKEEKRRWVYDFLKEKIKEGRQAYIIYPVIEETEDKDLKSLKEMEGYLKKELFPYHVGVFHGKMKNREKIEAIKKFKENKINILISTTIVEVGINIENATIMVVENPERFGLAQLHQLRGRIQRSSHQPYFIILSKNEFTENVLKRLEIISSVTDGFKIAEEDLKLRGPGDFFGYLQHGFPQLKIAHPLEDLEILKQARVFAYRIIKNDPYLEKPFHRCIKEHLSLWFKK